jgi:hypothetical protein
MDPDQGVKLIITVGLAAVATAFVFRRADMQDDKVVKGMLACFLCLIGVTWVFFVYVVTVVGILVAGLMLLSVLPWAIRFIGNTTADAIYEWRVVTGKSPPRSFALAKLLQEEADEYRQMGLPEDAIEEWVRWKTRHPDQSGPLPGKRPRSLPDGRRAGEARGDCGTNGNGEIEAGGEHPPPAHFPRGRGLPGGHRQQNSGRRDEPSE